MKGIPIKFRGVNIATDKYVYGYYSVMYSPYITSSEKADEYALYQVYPESVAQLIGYDVDGNEVYEGDVLHVGDPKLFNELQNCEIAKRDGIYAIKVDGLAASVNYNCEISGNVDGVLTGYDFKIFDLHLLNAKRAEESERVKHGMQDYLSDEGEKIE